MIGKDNNQTSMMQMISLEDLVPQDHFLRKLDRVLDLTFLPILLSPAYHPTLGREGIPPRLAMRMILIGYLYNLSEVRLCEEVSLHAAYRWFCRLEFHDSVPDRTTLVKFRKLCREHGLWETLFHRVVAQCLDVGLLSGRHLMADSTQVQANASIKSMREIESELIETADLLCAEEETANNPQKDDDHHRNDEVKATGKSKKKDDHQHTDFHGKKYSNKTHRSASDPDARFYRKGKGKEAKLSFKVHNLADTKSRVIVSTSATQVSGDDARDGAQSLALLDRFREHYGITPKTLCGDTAYGSAENIAGVVARGIAPHIPLLCAKPPPMPTWQRRTFNLDHARKRLVKVEQAKALHLAKELSTTQGYEISRKHRHRIEHLFGEAKLSHGLGRARHRGLAKMNEQATLTAIAQNLKRLVKHLDKPSKKQPNQEALRPKSPKFRHLSIFSHLRPPTDTVCNLFPSLLTHLVIQPTPGNV